MDQFNQNLSSASPDEAKSALRALFNAFPLAGHDDMGQVVGTYLIAINGYCLAAIQRAVTRFIRGEVDGHDGRFLPTPAQVSREVRYRQDMMTPPEPPRQALPAPVRQEPTLEERQRVSDRVREWVKDRTPAPLDGFKPREPGDIVRQMRAESLKLSAGALAALPPLMPMAEYHAWLDGTAVPGPGGTADWMWAVWDKASPGQTQLGWIRKPPPTPPHRRDTMTDPGAMSAEERAANLWEALASMNGRSTRDRETALIASSLRQAEADAYKKAAHEAAANHEIERWEDKDIISDFNKGVTAAVLSVLRLIPQEAA